MIKTQSSKEINQNCTSYMQLFESFEVKCVVTFYKEYFVHKLPNRTYKNTNY